VAENRTLDKDELSPSGSDILLDDVGSRDVCRHKVRRELDAFELEIQDTCQRLDKQGLGETRNAGDHGMGPYHHTNHDLLDHGILSDDDLAQFPEDLLVPMLEFFYERCIVGDDLLDVF